MLKKILVSTLAAVSLISTSVYAGERMAKDKEVYNPNNYRIEEDVENGMNLLIPDYFKQVYKDDNDPLEKYIPMLYTFEYSEEYGGKKQELAPVCIERIYRYYYYDDNNNKIYFDYGQSLNIYNINGKDYISIR